MIILVNVERESYLGFQVQQCSIFEEPLQIWLLCVITVALYLKLHLVYDLLVANNSIILGQNLYLGLNF